MKSENETPERRPTFAELLDHAEGRLTGARRARVEGYIAAHPQAVAGDLAWIQEFLKKAENVAWHPLPEGLEARLVGIGARAAPGRALAAEVGGWVTRMRQVVAELVNPEVGHGGLALAGAGLRAREFDNGARQWVYKTADSHIWVNALARADGRYDLHGQVYTLGDAVDFAACAVQLLADGEEAGLVTVDAHGEFVLTGIAVGQYGLVVADGDSEVVCEGLVLGE